MKDDIYGKRGYTWRLRVAMAIADIRCEELADRSGAGVSTVYNARSGRTPSRETRVRMMDAIETWKPGSIDIMLAAEARKRKSGRSDGAGEGKV